MLSVFREYSAIKANLAEILKASGYRNEYIARKIGLTPQNFAAKKNGKIGLSKNLKRSSQPLQNQMKTLKKLSCWK